MIPKSPQISYSAGMRENHCLFLSPADRVRLQQLAADRNSSAKVVWRAQIVLASADRDGTMAVMRRTGVSKPTVWRWQKRYMDQGVDGLLRDKTRPGRKPALAADVRLKVLTMTAQQTPANATHWSVRSMARSVGISHPKSGS